MLTIILAGIVWVVKNYTHDWLLDTLVLFVTETYAAHRPRPHILSLFDAMPKAMQPKPKSQRKRKPQNKTKRSQALIPAGGVRPNRAIRRAERAASSIKSSFGYVSAPAAQGVRIQRSPVGVARTTGTLVLAEASASSYYSSSTAPLFLCNLNPWLLNAFNGGTGSVVASSVNCRLSAMAMCFAEFRFKKLILRYVPECPSTNNGMLMVAYCENNATAATAATQAMGSVLQNAGNALFQLLSNESNCETNVWAPMTWKIPLQDKGWKQTDPFQALGLYSPIASAGSLAAVAHNISPPEVFGTFHLDYDVEFRDPVYTPGFMNITQVINYNFTVRGGAVANSPMMIDFSDLVGGLPAPTYDGPMIMVPSSSAELGTVGPTTYALTAGTAYIIQRLHLDAATVSFYIFASYADLMLNTPILNPVTIPGGGVAFAAQLQALSAFGT